MTRVKKRKSNSKIRNVFLTHIENNLKEYLLASLIFIIGILVGIIFFNNLSSLQIDDISSYLKSSIDTLKTNNNIDVLLTIKDGIKGNILLVGALWLMGSTVIGLLIVYLIVCFRGFSFGYTISAVIYTLGTGKGIIFLLITVLLKNIIVIPCTIGLAVSGMKLYKSIMQDRRKENIKLEIIRHTLFSLFILLVLIAITILDTYITSFSFKYYINYI